MSDAQEPVDGTEVDTQVSDPQGQTDQQLPEGGNPAWASLREELDPLSFSRIEPHLKNWDAGVNQRFEKLNEEFGWAREIAKAGRTPDFVQTSLQLADQINTDPLGAYQRIQQYLQQTGQLPPEVQQAVAEQQAQGQQAPGENPENAEYVDPQFQALQEQQQALQQQQEQMRVFLEEQARADMDRQADSSVDSEIQQLKAAHPEYSEQDIGEIIQRALIIGQKTGAVPTLEEADADYQALRNRLLSTPRAGASAPQLIPTGGGTSTPSAQGQASLGSLSNEQTQDLIAGLLQQNQG